MVASFVICQHIVSTCVRLFSHQLAPNILCMYILCIHMMDLSLQYWYLVHKGEPIVDI